MCLFELFGTKGYCSFLDFGFTRGANVQESKKLIVIDALKQKQNNVAVQASYLLRKGDLH